MNQLSHYTPCLSPLSGSVERNQQGEKELGRLQAVPSLRQSEGDQGGGQGSSGGALLN